MRIILHGDPALLEIGLEAARDVLANSATGAEPPRAWSRSWRGDATVVGADLVVEASKRTSTGRRRVTVVAGPEAVQSGVDPTDLPIDLRLGMLVDLLEKGERVLAAEHRDEALRSDRLIAALHEHPPSPGWFEAIARPGSARRPPWVDLKMAEGTVVRMSTSPGTGELLLPDATARILVDEAPHVEVWQQEREVIVRIGEPPMFRTKPVDFPAAVRAKRAGWS